MTSPRNVKMQQYEPLIGSGSHSARPRLGVSGDIIQFAASIFFADEDEGAAKIIVMRLGSMQDQVRVNFETRDGSAKAGDQYEPTSGRLTFEPGEGEKTIEVNLANDSTWHATMEFKVLLSDPESCQLGRYLHTTRVKVLDNDKFPSNYYTSTLEKGNDAVDKLQGARLFASYFKLNFKQRGIAWRTIITIIFDQMKNLYLLLTTYITVYLVDVVFNVKDEDTIHKCLWGDRLKTAEIVAVVYAVPLLVLHIWDYVKIKLDLAGLSTYYLRANIIRRYMNFSEESRIEMDLARMQTLTMTGTEDLVEGYNSVLEISHILGNINILTFFTLQKNPHCGWVILLMPVLIFIFMMWRHFLAPEVVDPEDALHNVMRVAHEISSEYKLIAHYFARPQMNERFTKAAERLRRDSIPDALVTLNNESFPNWVGTLLVAVYIIIQAPAVLNGRTAVEGRTVTLGTFIATIGVISEIAGQWSNLYTVAMAIVDKFGTIKDMTKFFNYPTDLKEWLVVSRMRREKTAGDRQVMLAQKSSSETKYLTDTVPIQLMGTCFQYVEGKPLLQNMNLSVKQGSLVAIIGPHSSGKRTLLMLLAHEIFPRSGSVFVPGHLRIIQVSMNVMLFRESPWMNLTFALQPGDVDVGRIKSILHDLDMPKITELVQNKLDERKKEGEEEKSQEEEPEEEDNVPQNWIDHLSSVEIAKLHIARAFIANPEVLIMQRPLRHFDDVMSKKVQSMIREHIDERGLNMPDEGLEHRRPRTVFFTVEGTDDLASADVVWRIHSSSHTCVEMDKNAVSQKDLNKTKSLHTPSQ